MSAIITPVFGKAIYEKLLDLDIKKIVSMIDTTKRTGTKITSNGLHVLDDKKLKFLKDILLKEFYAYAWDKMKYTNNHFNITTSWFTQVNPTKSSQFHNHTNCFMSGVLYLQTTPDSGDIIFQEFGNKAFNLLPSEFNLYNSKEWIYKPQNGLLLLFPSDLYHRVKENESKHIRHSLAFNFMPTGLLGDKRKDSHIIIKS
tara:strand:+ start:276 stop:875 length:600 start_codon:yes stop_codon:yes gene_type:complete